MQAGHIKIGQQHNELVAGQPGRQIGATGQVFQRLRQRQQDLIAHSMPVAIVDALEIVDVEQDQGDGMLSFGQSLGLRKARFEGAPVGQPRQRIGQAQMLQACALLLQMQRDQVDVLCGDLEFDIVRHDRRHRFIAHQGGQGIAG